MKSKTTKKKHSGPGRPALNIFPIKSNSLISKREEPVYQPPKTIKDPLIETKKAEMTRSAVDNTSNSQTKINLGSALNIPLSQLSQQPPVPPIIEISDSNKLKKKKPL